MGIHLLEKVMHWVLNPDGSISVDDPDIIKTFTDDTYFPYLVSFPRTGSHWLRMIMELYFEKPSLVRVFYFRNSSEFTCFHTHDMDLNLQRRNVIYLYRNVVDTVYSQLRYYKEDPDNQERQRYWTNLYAQHISKWLINDDFTCKKTVITYEGMRSDMHGEIKKLCMHFGVNFDPLKLNSVLAHVSKDELKKKTKHDQQVVNLTDAYEYEKEMFRKKYAKSIIDDFVSAETSLERIVNMWLSDINI